MTSFAFEQSGQLQLPSQEELLLADEDCAILAYSNGTLADGQPYWAYVAVKPSLYREFYARSSAREALTLSAYGEVLAMDYGEIPPDDVRAYMQLHYGADPAYEQNLIDEANTQQEAFVKQREDKRINDIVTMMKLRKTTE